MRFCGKCGSSLEDSSLPKPATEAKAREPGLPKHLPNIDPEQIGVLTGSNLLERFRKAGLEASGQRRGVTILFVDLSGFTSLSEQLGDEELYHLMQRFILLLVNDVYKYEGMVDKLTGDGLMALFGAPITYENNAERAIRSALEMVTDVEKLSQELSLDGHELRIHVGLNSGSVIVGGVGGEELMNYTAIGDSVNLARRLEENAGPGVILASESVYRQTYRQFTFEKQPPLSLKNISKEVTAYRVLGARDRLASMRGIEGLRAPMIGRENEFAQISGLVHRLVEEKIGGVILLAGEGGMGKSRLTTEIKAQMADLPLLVLEGQSLTYRKSIPYWIFQDLLRHYMGLPGDASLDVVQQRLVETAEDVFGGSAKEHLPYLEYLFSISPTDPNDQDRIKYLDPGQLQQQVFLAFRDFIVSVSHRRPVLLILEDLHWADNASIDMLRFLIDTARSAPLLIYAITRPFEGGMVQAIHERALQRLGDRYFYLRLQALLPDQSAQLLNALLSIQDLPDGLRTQIVQRSAGLPFYLEEILRMLIERKFISRVEDAWRLASGAESAAVGVPETLQGLILTRFDRLSLIHRRILQTATVIGYQFSYHVLSQVLQAQVEGINDSEIREAIDLLVEREFITAPDPHDRSSVDQESIQDPNYQFKHVLVSDAVYSTLLHKDRRELHCLVGESIERIYSGHLDGFIEVLAGHFLRSPHLDRALVYLILAGQKASHSYANEQALQLFRQALELLPNAAHTPDQAMQVHNGLGDALLTAGEYAEAREQFVHALDAVGVPAKTDTLRVLGDERIALPISGTDQIRITSQLQRKIGKTHEGQGDYEKALVYLQMAQNILRHNQSAFSLEQASTLNDAGWVYSRQGNLDKAEQLFIQGLQIAEQAGQLDVTASILNRLAGIYFQREMVDKAYRYVQRSLVIREQIGDIVAVARSYNNLGLLSWKQGQLHSALDHFNRSFHLQTNLGDVEGLIVLHTNMGAIEMDCGNLAEAQKHYQEALQTAVQIGHSYHECKARMHLALLNVYAGKWSTAIEYGAASLDGFQELGVSENILDINVSMGWAYLGLGNESGGNDIQTKIRVILAEEESRQGGFSEGQGRAYRLLARFASERGDLSGAHDMLQKSALIFERLGTPLERGRSLVDLGNLMTAYGKMAEAKNLFSEAKAVFEQMGAKLELSKMQLLAHDIL